MCWTEPRAHDGSRWTRETIASCPGGTVSSVTPMVCRRERYRSRRHRRFGARNCQRLPPPLSQRGRSPAESRSLTADSSKIKEASGALDRDPTLSCPGGTRNLTPRELTPPGRCVRASLARACRCPGKAPINPHNGGTRPCGPTPHPGKRRTTAAPCCPSAVSSVRRPRPLPVLALAAVTVRPVETVHPEPPHRRPDRRTLASQPAAPCEVVVCETRARPHPPGLPVAGCLPPSARRAPFRRRDRHQD